MRKEKVLKRIATTFLAIVMAFTGTALYPKAADAGNSSVTWKQQKLLIYRNMFGMFNIKETA